MRLLSQISLRRNRKFTSGHATLFFEEDDARPYTVRTYNAPKVEVALD